MTFLHDYIFISLLLNPFICVTYDCKVIYFGNWKWCNGKILKHPHNITFWVLEYSLVGSKGGYTHLDTCKAAKCTLFCPLFSVFSHIFHSFWSWNMLRVSVKSWAVWVFDESEPEMKILHDKSAKNVDHSRLAVEDWKYCGRVHSNQQLKNKY